MPSWRLVFRGLKFVLAGALIGAVVGFIAFLPGSIPTVESGHPTRMPWSIAMGVAFWCARMGGLVGLLSFFLYRTLTGEVSDPRNVSPVRQKGRRYITGARRRAPHAHCWPAR